MKSTHRTTPPTQRGGRDGTPSEPSKTVHCVMLHRPGNRKGKGGGGLDQQTEAMGAWTFAGSAA